MIDGCGKLKWPRSKSPRTHQRRSGVCSANQDKFIGDDDDGARHAQDHATGQVEELHSRQGDGVRGNFFVEPAQL